MQLDDDYLAMQIQALLLCSGQAMTVVQLQELCAHESGEIVDADAVRRALQRLETLLEQGVMELVEVASGYRLHIRQPWVRGVQRLQEDKPQRFSRALMETLALIAYRQPITRGEIEEIRGVAVSTQIIRTLQEREWVRVAGYREVPGRPALLVTTRQFLDSFGLKKISDLPPLAELSDLLGAGAHVAPE